VPDLKELLKQLQATDTELQELTTQKEAIPTTIEDLKAQIEKLRSDFQTLKETLTNSKKDVKLAELNLASQEETLARYNAQLFSAKTNEEYKAFLKEIEVSEKKKGLLEDRIIAIMEEIETEETQLGKRESEHKQEIAARETEIVEIQTSESELAENIKKLSDQRDRLREEISKDALAIYDRIYKSKNAIAVAQILEDDRCGACLNPVPAQIAIETSQSDHLTFCEYCGRILVV
jgi:predicted  nucleic acid-binding Zn-ribbon protein